MHRVKGTSLLETIVAAVLFLTVFATTMELLPRLTVRDDDAVLVAEARYRLERAFDKYAAGVWPCGEYVEAQAWGTVEIRIEPYRDYADIRLLTLCARIDCNRKRLTLKRLIECRDL